MLDPLAQATASSDGPWLEQHPSEPSKRGRGRFKGGEKRIYPLVAPMV